MNRLRIFGVLIMMSLPGSFAGAQGVAEDVFKVSQPIVRTTTFFLQADQLIYDTAAQHVTTDGNVEVHCTDNILTTDRIVFDRARNILKAEGNIVLKDSKGYILRADSFVLDDSFRDAFAEGLDSAVQKNLIQGPTKH